MRERLNPIAMVRRMEASHSYGFVLVLVVISFVFFMSAPDARWSRTVGIALQSATLLLTLWTARSKERSFIWAFGAVGAAAGVTVIAVTRNGPNALGALLLVSALLVVAVPFSIAVGVIRGVIKHGVTVQAVFGVIAVYLLIGLLFAFAYGAIANIGSGALFTNGTDGSFQDHIYFSFATITTVGYGDFAPATQFARALAVTEALIGQLYLVTIVALIVGNLGARRRA